MKNFEDRLREYQLKATPQRIAITKLLDEKGHLNIDTLYNLLKEDFTSLSLATIYKNINIMMEKSFVKEVKLPNRKSVYELQKEHHSHLVCKKCNKIEDIYIQNIECFYDEVNQKTDFAIESSDITVIGLCKQCR